MQDHKSFFQLDNNGIVHHVHSDSYHIHMVYEDTEDNKLYRLTLDKDYMVASCTQVQTPAPVSELQFIKWHRPGVDQQNEMVFTGCVTTDAGDYRFSIDDSNFTLVAPVKINESFGFQDLAALNGLEVDFHVQKGNLLYVIGWDLYMKSYAFAEVHLGTDKAIRRYTLESDDGQLLVRSLNIDPWCGRIYIAGEIKSTSTEQEQSTSRAYLETFCYYKPTTS